MGVNKGSFFSKIWKSLAALAIVYGLLSPTNVKMDFNLWIIILVSVIFFVIYWHFLEKMKEKINSIKRYFSDLKRDIKYIRDKTNKKG